MDYLTKEEQEAISIKLEERNISRVALAGDVSINTQRLYSILQGKKKAKPDEHARIIEALQIDLGQESAALIQEEKARIEVAKKICDMKLIPSEKDTIQLLPDADDFLKVHGFIHANGMNTNTGRVLIKNTSSIIKTGIRWEDSFKTMHFTLHQDLIVKGNVLLYPQPLNVEKELCFRVRSFEKDFKLLRFDKVIHFAKK